MKIPILIYHSLDSASQPSDAKCYGDLIYAVNDLTFEEHLRALAGEGYRSVSLKDFVEKRLSPALLPPKPIILTFDDGHISNYTRALPILVRNGFIAEFFVITGSIGASNGMRPDQIRELRRSGMGIGSHGNTHRYLDGLPEEEVRRELGRSKTALEEILEEPIISYSPPGGKLHSGTREIASSCGYKILCTSVPRVNRPDTSPLDLGRICVKRGTGDKALIRNIRNTGTLRMQLKYRFIEGVKNALGNDMYQLLRGKVLSIGREKLDAER